MPARCWTSSFSSEPFTWKRSAWSIGVTSEEESQRIKEILPTAWSGDAWLKDKYASEVQLRTGMSVEDFESALRDQMLSDKFRQIVTGGISVEPGGN